MLLQSEYLRAPALASAEGMRYLDTLTELLTRLREVGPARISPDELARTRRRLAAAQIRYLVANDTSDGYYGNCFSHLAADITAAEIEPDLLLDHMVYRAAHLVGGRAQQLRQVRGLPPGGRVFHSSGTTNPGNRKRVYYDPVTIAFLTGVNLLHWEGAAGCRLGPGASALFMMPRESPIGMAYALFLSDMYSRAGMGIWWASRFINPPVRFVDEIFGVETASMVFKDNLVPDPSSMGEFAAACRSGSGPHIVEGFLPSVHALLCGPDGKSAMLRPTVIGYGGGLKRNGIPPRLLAAGGAALDLYLDRVRDMTGVDPRALGALRADRPADVDFALESLLTVFLTYEVEQATGARMLHIYAGAEILPCFFSVGTLPELFGNDYVHIKGDAPPASIFVPAPGTAVQLRDPTTDEVIPPSTTGRVGILRFWDPFNVSHLHAIETEDQMCWTPIPEAAPYRPAYANGVGLTYCGRLANSKAGGYCAS